MKNVERVAELFKQLFVDDWEKAVVSGVIRNNDNGLSYDFYFSTKVNGEYTEQIRSGCNASALSYEAAQNLADGEEYKFTMVLYPNNVHVLFDTINATLTTMKPTMSRRRSTSPKQVQ